MLYVYANVKIKYGRLPAFNEAMATVKRVMEANGWRLVGALHEIHDVWEVADANVVPAAFAAAYQDPDFVQAATDLSKIIDREVLSLVTKTPYSP